METLWPNGSWSQKYEGCQYKTTQIIWLTATPSWAVIQPDHFCVAFKLLDEARLANSTAAAVSQGYQLLHSHSQCSILGIAIVITAYCRDCIQEFLTTYLC